MLALVTSNCKCTLSCDVNILACFQNKGFFWKPNECNLLITWCIVPPQLLHTYIHFTITLTFSWESLNPFSVPSRPNIDKKETYIYQMNFVSKHLSPQSHTKWSKVNVQKVGWLTQECSWQYKYFRSTLLQCNLVRQPLIVVKRHVAANLSQVVNPSQSIS